MVSAAKYAKAERELKPARAYGEGAYGRLNNGKRREILTFPTPLQFTDILINTRQLQLVKCCLQAAWKILMFFFWCVFSKLTLKTLRFIIWYHNLVAWPHFNCEQF